MSDYLNGNPGRLEIGPTGEWLCPKCDSGGKRVRLDAKDRVVESTCYDCGFDWLRFKASAVEVAGDCVLGTCALGGKHLTGCKRGLPALGVAKEEKP